MSPQLGETFLGCKIQRPVQRVLRTENPLLFKHNELPKIFLPPPPPQFLKASYGPAKRIIGAIILLCTYSVV